MIIFFITLAILILGIVLFIWVNRTSGWSEVDMWIGGTILTIMGVILVAEIFTFITLNCSYNKQEMLIKQQDIIEELNNTYDTLSNKENSDLLRLQINEYNEKVKDYKTNIKLNKLRLKNKWINWFVSPIYNDFTGEEVKYIKGEE